MWFPVQNSMDFEMLWYQNPPDEAAFKKCNRTSFYSSLVCCCKSGDSLRHVLQILQSNTPHQQSGLVESPFTTEWFKRFWSSNFMRTPTSSKGHWVRTWAAAAACQTSHKSTEVPKWSWHEGVFDDHWICLNGNTSISYMYIEHIYIYIYSHYKSWIYFMTSAICYHLHINLYIIDLCRCMELRNNMKSFVQYHAIPCKYQCTCILQVSVPIWLIGRNSREI